MDGNALKNDAMNGFHLSVRLNGAVMVQVLSYDLIMELSSPDLRRVYTGRLFPSASAQRWSLAFLSSYHLIIKASIAAHKPVGSQRHLRSVRL